MMRRGIAVRIALLAVLVMVVAVAVIAIGVLIIAQSTFSQLMVQAGQSADTAHARSSSPATRSDVPAVRTAAVSPC